MAPTLQSLGSNIMASPIANNLMSLLSTGWSGGDNRNVPRVSQRKRSLTMKDEPETEHGHRKGLSVVTMTALVSTLLIQVQVELECTIRRHTKAMRKSEVDMLAYDLDAPLLGQQEEVVAENVGLVVVN